MSSSFRDLRRFALVAGSALGFTVAHPAGAAQTYVQPQVDVRAETNSNLGLDPDGSPDGTVEGYIADMQVLFGYNTQRAESSLRPRLRFQHYPDRDEREAVEAFLDWVTRYSWERSQFDLKASYALQDSYNFDTRSGEFDPIDPNGPTTPGAGRTLIGETQTDINVRPRFTYDLTERVKLGVGGEYQTTTYDADSGQPDQVDYDYALANADVRWALDERSNVGIGAFVSQYDPKQGNDDSDGYGVGVTYDRQWSEALGLELIAGYETNDPKYPEPGAGDQSTSSFGGSVSLYGKGEVTNWRFYAGQRYAPNADGRVRQVDQARFQYDRKFSQRLIFRGAARYESQEQLSSSPTVSNRDTARVDLNLRWLLTRTWYVQGGYAYVWQDEEDVGDANNNKFFLSFGYRGLGRER